MACDLGENGAMKRAVSNWFILIPVAVALWVQILIGSADYVSNQSWWFKRLLAPEPYRDVQLLRVDRSGGVVNVRANFIKSQCHKVRFQAVGEAAGVFTALEWIDADDRPDDESREPGRQTLTGQIVVGSLDFDVVEIRTRHICGGNMEVVGGVETATGGTVVDEVFARFDPSIVVTPDNPVSGHAEYIGPKGGY